MTWVVLALFAPTPAAATDLPPMAQIMALPPALQARLQQEVLLGHPTQKQRLDRLVHFVFDKDGLGITYQDDATYTVEQAYAARKVNCLSFTLLFLALARESRLVAYPQEVGETPTWREVDGTIYRDNHINAGVQIGGNRYSVDVAQNSVLKLKRPVRVSEQRLLSHYFNNVAVESFLRGEKAVAMQAMDTSLQLDPGYAPHWSNAGVLYMHSADADAAKRAEHAYAKALSLDPRDANALFNMVDLSRRNGDHRSEAEYRERLAQVEQRDPVQQFLQARDFERTGDFPQAIEHYRRAIFLDPGDHRFYAALARVYLRIGDIRHARDALIHARTLTDGAMRAAYQKQIDDLQQDSG